MHAVRVQERLPCQFATVDLADVMGTSLTNVTAEIVKFRVAPDAGHKDEFYVEQPRSVKHEEMHEHELALFTSMPENVPQVTARAPVRGDRASPCRALERLRSLAHASAILLDLAADGARLRSLRQDE